eukprot:gb/GECG01012535.1/.p1 GENE.gb/GECG01012535.1/~~gb/GECG01012535.1/.p1  ORF type:complete len:160 (+),score=10.96 gb/GECG01012535.1/:1-480(+)
MTMVKKEPTNGHPYFFVKSWAHPPAKNSKWDPVDWQSIYRASSHHSGVFAVPLANGKQEILSGLDPSTHCGWIFSPKVSSCKAPTIHQTLPAGFDITHDSLSLKHEEESACEKDQPLTEWEQLQALNIEVSNVGLLYQLMGPGHEQERRVTVDAPFTLI